MTMLTDKINTTFNKFFIYLFIYILLFVPNCFAEKKKEIKVGILLGFTGAVESLTPSMADSAELAFNEIKNNELTFKILRSDTACNNMSLAKNATNKLVNDGVSAIIGAACPNITKEIDERSVDEIINEIQELNDEEARILGDLKQIV